MLPIRRVQAVLLVWMLLLASCATPAPNTPPTPTTIPTPADPGVLAAGEASMLRQRIPALAQRDERLAAALDLPVPVLEYTGTLDDAQKAAQSIALQNADFLRYVRDPISSAPFRSEIFGVYPAKPSDLTDASAACRSSSCYRVEMYNYALNLASVATVSYTHLSLPLPLMGAALYLAVYSHAEDHQQLSLPGQQHLRRSPPRAYSDRNLCQLPQWLSHLHSPTGY